MITRGGILWLHVPRHVPLQVAGQTCGRMGVSVQKHGPTVPLIKPPGHHPSEAQHSKGVQRISGLPDHVQRPCWGSARGLHIAMLGASLGEG